MQGVPRYCEKCGHRCHCYTPDCEECINDVCTVCECGNRKDIPDSFTKETT